MSESSDYKKHNGKLVMATMMELRQPATLQKIRGNILEKLEGQIDEGVVTNEIRKVLRKGVNNGFIERDGRRYQVYSMESRNENEDIEEDQTPVKKSRSRSISKKPSRSNYKNPGNMEINLKDFMIQKDLSKRASRTRSPMKSRSTMKTSRSRSRTNARSRSRTNTSISASKSQLSRKRSRSNTKKY